MSGKAFASKAGTVWECKDPDCEVIFLVLDDHVTLEVTRPQPRVKGAKYRKNGPPVDMLFRNYLDMETGKASFFSKDSLMNKTARRV